MNRQRRRKLRRRERRWEMRHIPQLAELVRLAKFCDAVPHSIMSVWNYKP